jgi:hypothetical protein
MEVFKLEDVTAIEAQVLAELGYSRQPTDPYFLEAVAQVLYKAWASDHSDNRIVVYAFPMVKSLIVKHRKIFRGTIYSLEQGRGSSSIPQNVYEIFCLIIISLVEKVLPKYSADKGKLYSYLTYKVEKRILDFYVPIKKQGEKLKLGKCHPSKVILEGVLRDRMIYDSFTAELAGGSFDNSQVNQYHDFRSFLQSLSRNQGTTSRRILQSLYSVIDIDGPHAGACDNQAHIVQLVAQQTKLPAVLVKLYLDSVLGRYRHSVID